MALLGLLLIAGGWFIQYRSGSQTFEKSFLMLYIGGTLLLVLDNLTFDRLLLALLNLIVFVLAILVAKHKPTRSKTKARRRR